jgi:beta-N-acetylhexosaminidase
MTRFGHLRGAPFHLDDAGVAWVEQTLTALTPAQRVGQLFVHIVMGNDPAALQTIMGLNPAGITRFYSADLSYEENLITRAQSAAAVPLLVSADLEGSRMSLPFATEVPNPLALAAINDVAATREISTIMAAQARAIGINWSFTPVLDINAAFRSPIVATRGFGSDPAIIQTHALTQIDVFQRAGMAATVKHWPGEGHDDRDQHLVTTINPLSLPDWYASHGALYRAAIDAGVMAVMSAHIALPAYVLAKNPDAGIEAYRPASLSKTLNCDLLRGDLGFNGLIVSDATPMAGFGAWGPRSQTLPQVIENGCDIILFSNDPAADFALIEAAIADGRISPARHEAALIRILGLKAALGLHKGAAPPDLTEFAPEKLGATRKTARAITARAPTLVKDVQGMLPLSPAKHKRLAIYSGGVVVPFAPHPLPLDLPDMLAREGFEVTMLGENAQPNPAKFDAMLYLFAEETLLTRGRIFLDWAKVGGDFQRAMDRHWYDIPTAIISFGYPYYLYDAPRVPTYINAYATMPSMQEAVLDCLLGRAPWAGTPPHDPFCGLGDAQF